MISAIILAGGHSRRMGRDKCQLTLGAESLVARSVRMLAELTQDIILVTHSPELFAELAVRTTNDAIPGGGALSGIHAGLLAATHEQALVVACDMPFLSRRLIEYLASVVPGYDAAVPRWKGEYEALHSIYTRSCIEPIEPILRRGGGRIVELYQHIKVRYVQEDEIIRYDPQGLSFFNVNSPDDWAKAQSIAAHLD